MKINNPLIIPKNQSILNFLIPPHHQPFHFDLCKIRLYMDGCFFFSFIIISMLEQAYRRLCCETRPSYPQPYTFSFDERSHQTNKELFQSNEIKTTKYNAFNFLPKSIVSQYQRLANFYFLLVAIISTIPDVSPLFPGLIWAPLVTVLLISIIKELYEDYQRYSTDKIVNESKFTNVLRDGSMQIIKWKDVVVGDLCRVYDDSLFPADLVLISSSDADGIAYIETASLDGEQTSKIRYAFPQLNAKYREIQNKSVNGRFTGDVPSPALAQFRGTLQIDEMKHAINDCSQLLFRGAKLRNTEWVWGLVIYTGQCSKIMMNGQSFVTKFSHLERRLNYLLILMLLLQLTGCLVVAGLATQKRSSIQGSDYLIWPSGYGKARIFIYNFLMFFVEFSSCIPVALIVTIEIAKTAQSYFIDFDQLMYSVWRKRKVYARTATLNQQLGQVEYVFCDKTGTLTKNILTFHTAVIGNLRYQFQYSPETKEYQCPSLLKDLRQKRTDGTSLRGSQVWQGKHLRQIEDYMMCLLFCNSINIIEKEGQFTYESESPDELAIIKMAKCMGFILLKRDKNSVLVDIQGKEQRVQILARFPFTSQRKRMSVIIRMGGNHLLYTKGADNLILERAQNPSTNIRQSVDHLSYNGLRILLVSKRVLPQQEVEEMIRDLRQAEMNQREVIMEESADKFEKDLTVLGATGLLDELQDGVPETLRDFQRAGIRTWMLTGDKLQTAIEVAKSCNLIAPDYEIVLMKPSITPVRVVLQESRQKITNSLCKYTLVIEGSVLSKITDDEDIEKQFAQLTLFFMSVICCRMLPVQKSQAVGMIKKHLYKICLAVGDGGNDVSMIKQANIGVGLYGEEGMSAVQASDYAIPEFRMLWRLLFVHGRWNYMRISEMVLYFLYKSLIFTIPRFLFSFHNGYSGYPIFDDLYIALYNIVFTALPLLIRALMQQDVNYVVKGFKDIGNQNNFKICKIESTYLPSGFTINIGLRRLFPKIYYVGQKNEIFNFKQSFLWLIQAIAMGICIYFVVTETLDTISVGQSGINSNLYYISITIFTAIIIIDTIKLCMQVNHWTKLLLFTIIVLSIVPYVGFMWVVNYYFQRPLQKILVVAFSSAKAYFSVVALSIILICFNGIFVYWRFHSHRILKKMKIAIEEDIDMIDYFSRGSEACISDEERKMHIREIESLKAPINSGDMEIKDLNQQ